MIKARPKKEQYFNKIEKARKNNFSFVKVLTLEWKLNSATIIILASVNFSKVNFYCTMAAFKFDNIVSIDVLGDLRAKTLVIT